MATFNFENSLQGTGSVVVTASGNTSVQVQCAGNANYSISVGGNPAVTFTKDQSFDIGGSQVLTVTCNSGDIVVSSQKGL